MALNNTINPQDYYSYKDWGQKAFDITNTFLDAGPMGGGGGGGGGGFGGFGGGQNGGQGGGFGGMFKNMFGNSGGANSGGTFDGGGSIGNIGGSLGNFGDMSSWLKVGQNANQTPQYGTMGQMFNFQNGDWLGGGLGMQKGSNAWGSQGVKQQAGGAGGNGFNAIMQAGGTGNAKADTAIGAMGDMQNIWTGSSDTWGNIGKTINVGNQAIVKMVGNQFKDPGQRIAYGDSTYAAMSRRDLEKKTNQYVKGLRNTSFYSNAGSMQDLASEVNKGGIYTDVSRGVNQKQKILGTAQRSLNLSGKGAELGSKIGKYAGPMGSAFGTIIGGVAGGIAGIFGGAFGARRGRERLRKIQAAQRFANMARDRQIQDTAANIGSGQVNQMMATQLAKGGRIERLINGRRLDGMIRTRRLRPDEVAPFFE